MWSINKTQDLKVNDDNSVMSITARHWTESESPHTVVDVGDEEFLAICFEVKSLEKTNLETI